MPVRVYDLAPGDEVQGWMKLGLALQPKRTARGINYYKVPYKASRAKSGDLTRFRGWVVGNNTTTGVLTVEISPVNSLSQPTSRGSVQAEIPYTSLKRLRLFSRANFDPREQFAGDKANKTYRRPGSLNKYTALKPYRVLTEVVL